MVYPFSVIVLTSFKTDVEVYTNPYGFPQNWTFDNFLGAWNKAHLDRLFVNSLFLTSVSIVAAIFCSSLAAYGLARAVSRWQGVIYLFFVSGIFIPVQLSIIPLFKIVKDLHLFNSYLGVICVYVGAGIPFGVFLITTFMRNLPKEIIEAAIMDGCSYYGLYWRIYLPLVKSVISTYAILQGLTVWNDFLIPLLLLTDETKRTLTTGIMSFKQQYNAQWGYLMAGIVMMVVPILIVYVVLQKFILKGITTGAVKG